MDDQSSATPAPGQLAELLAIGSELAEQRQSSAERHATLRHILEEHLSRQFAIEVDGSAKTACDTSEGSGPGAPPGSMLRDLLLNKSTDLALVQAAKSKYRLLARRHRKRESYPVYVSLYFAAIASALAHCDAKISSYDYATLAGHLKQVGAKLWIPDELRELFRQATVICLARRP